MLVHAGKEPAQAPQDQIKLAILERAKHISSRWEVGDGRQVAREKMALQPDNISVARDGAARTLVLQIGYRRLVRHPFLKWATPIAFSPSVRIDYP